LAPERFAGYRYLVFSTNFCGLAEVAAKIQVARIEVHTNLVLLVVRGQAHHTQPRLIRERVCMIDLIEKWVSSIKTSDQALLVHGQ
jgi:hypothetical protein